MQINKEPVSHWGSGTKTKRHKTDLYSRTSSGGQFLNGAVASACTPSRPAAGELISLK